MGMLCYVKLGFLLVIFENQNKYSQFFKVPTLLIVDN